MYMINSLARIKNRIFKTDARSSRMRMNTLAMLVIKGGSIFLSLISASIILNNVDRADYGVLLTLTSIVNWVSMMDIGIGNGLRNILPGYFADGNFKKAQMLISSCYAVLFIYISVLILVFYFISPYLDWLSILNSPNSNKIEIINLANVVFLSFCLNFFLGLFNSVLYAYQMPAFQSLFAFIGQVLSVSALLFQIYVLHVSSVFQIGAVNCLIPPLVLFFASVIIYRRKLKHISPSFKYVNIKSVSGILSLGVKFFLLQVITIILFQANSIIIAKSVGPEAVVEYNLAFKYISVLSLVFNIVITPIWSATTDAYVLNDFVWIKKTLLYIRRICVVFITIGLVMVLCSNFIYNVWLGHETINISISTTLLVYIYLSFEMLYKVYGTIINGTGKVTAQMIITGVIAIIYLPLAYHLGTHFGLSGVLFANCIVFFLNYLWSRVQCLKLINQTATGIWDK